MTNLVPALTFDDVVEHPTTELLLAGPGGPLNRQAQSLLNRTQVLKQFQDDLVDATDPAKGAAKVGRNCVAVDSMVALLTVPTSLAKHVSLASYHSGWAVTTYGPLGGSFWAWNASKPKSAHNGFDVTSPTVPWNGSFATLGAFQAGTGETAPGTNGCWVRIHGANDLVSWGSIPFSGTNNAITMANAIAWAYNKKQKMQGNSGTFEYSGTLDMSYPTLVFRGNGFRNTILKCTSSGLAIAAIGTRPNNGVFSFGIELADFTVEGNAATTDLILLRINRPTINNINLREASVSTGCALRIQGTVAGQFNNITCSTNTQLMTSRPATGIILEGDPTLSGARASANKFTNAVIEGMSIDGIQLQATDQNTFTGGTSENNGGVGIAISAGCRINTFIGMGFENFGFADVSDEGEMNQFLNCYGTKMIYHGASSKGHYVRGGYWQNVLGDIAAISPDIDDIQYNFLGSPTPVGTFNVPSVTAKVGNNIRNVQAGTQYYHKKAKTPITPTSGVAITNTYGIDVDIYVSGGTVSANQENRDGVAFGVLPVAGKFFQRPNDGITLTFTVAPTVFIVPRS